MSNADLVTREATAPPPPFPWFGAKRRVAGEVWAALGDAQHYVEPFAGSLAVLLGRPAAHRGRCSTVNDLDRYVANFWRATTSAPEEVARHADHPVNETDLEARHLWLVNEGRARLARLRDDPAAFDAQVAGWWAWGVCCWIGSGWCAGGGDKRPHLGSDSGVHRGVNRQIPHLGNEGRGVNRQIPHPGNEGQGVPGDDPVAPDLPLPRAGSCAARTAHLLRYFARLRGALRDVRVCCGDWSRVLTHGTTAYGATVGVFLDPPYADAVRTRGLYAEDAGGDELSAAVRAWALERGDDPRFRIVLAGYEPEHEAHLPASWRRVAWKASAAYRGSGEESGNRHLERLWLSPHCLGSDRSRQADLFGGAP